MGYVQPSDEFDAAVTDLREAIRAKTKATTTFGYGPRFLHSTGQFHKGGPPTGLFLQLIHDGDEDVEIPEAGYTFGHLKNAQAVGDLLTLRDHGLPAVQVRLEGDPAAAVQALQEEISDAARLRRPRQDGRQHGAPDPPRLGAYVRRVRLQRGRGPRGRGARSHRLARGARLEARGAALGLDHGAGRRPDAGTVDQLASCSTRATRSSTAATRAGRTTSAARRRSPEGIHYVDVGVSGGVWGLQVGYCMMVGGPDEAVERLAPILDVLAPPGPPSTAPAGGTSGDRRRPLREDGPQRCGVRDDAGLRRGLRALRRVRVRARQRQDRPPLDAGLGRALVAVRAGGARVRAGGQRPAPIAPYVEDSGEGRWTVEDAIDKRIPMPVITTSLYERFSSRGRTRSRPRSTRRCATSSAATRSRRRIRSPSRGPRRVAWRP